MTGPRALPPRLRAPLRRTAVSLAALACAAAAAALPQPAAGASAHRAMRDVLVVGNSYDGTADLIDQRTLRRLGRPLDLIPDGSTPRDPGKAATYPAVIRARGELNYAQEVALSPGGRTLYVSRGYLGDVAAFDLATRRLRWRVDLPSVRADHLAVSPDGRRLFATSLPGTRVYAIDTRSHAIAGSYEAGDYPHVLAFSPDGRELLSGSLGDQLAPFGADRGSHLLTVADPRTLRVLRTYRFGAGVRPFAFVPRTHDVVLQLSYFSGFTELDLRTGRTVRTVALPLSPPALALPKDQYPNKAAHHGIAVSGDGRLVCDAGTISGYVALVPLVHPRRRTLIPVAPAPGEAVTSTDGRRCFVADRGPTALHRGHVGLREGDAVSVISYARRREVRRLRAGVHPQSEAVGRVPRAVLRAGHFTR
jgi:DNA-binding beta-propeller fold protein YncE